MQADFDARELAASEAAMAALLADEMQGARKQNPPKDKAKQAKSKAKKLKKEVRNSCSKPMWPAYVPAWQKVVAESVHIASLPIRMSVHFSADFQA